MAHHVLPPEVCLGPVQLQELRNSLRVGEAINQWRGGAFIEGRGMSEEVGLQHCLMCSTVYHNCLRNELGLCAWQMWESCAPWRILCACF